MIRPKKVLFILSSLYIGGAENQTVQLANNIDPERFRIYFTYLDHKQDLISKIDRSNIRYLKCLKRKGKIDLNVVHFLAKLLQQYDIDIVYCVNEYPLLYAWLARQLLRLRSKTQYRFRLAVSIHHSTLLETPWKNIKNSIYRVLINRCDRVVFVSKKQLKKWTADYRINARISEQIYNAVDCNHFGLEIPADQIEQVRTELKLQADDFVAGMCAVLRTEKNHQDFIWALHQCRLKGRPIKGLLIGDGPARKQIERFAASLRMEEHIRITGFHGDVRPLISCCNCLVNASHSVEAHSMAALEAMAMGKTMVMSDVGGASETIVHGQTGFLYDGRDRPSLVALLCQLIDNAELNLTMGHQARERVKDLYPLPKMIEAYERLFDAGLPK